MRIRQAVLPFLLFLCGTVFLNAQTVEWTAPEDAERKFPYLKIIGQDEEGYFVLKSNFSFELSRNRIGFTKRTYSLSYYTFKSGLRWRKPVVFTKKHSAIEKIIAVDGKILLVTSVFNKSAREYGLYVQYINSQGAYEKQPAAITSIPADQMPGSGVEAVASLSGEQTACIIRYVAPGNNRQVFSIVVLNDTLGVSWKKNFEIPHPVSYIAPQQFGVGDDGRVYMLGQKPPASKESKSAYALIPFSPEETAEEKEIRIPDKNLTDAGMKIDDITGRVYISGFYSDKTSFSTAGVFYATYDPAPSAITFTGHQKFDDAFIDKFVGERKTTGKELIHYSIDRLVLRNDSGLVIVAEASYVTEYSYYDVFTQSIVTRTNYNYNNILIISVNSDGTIDWSQVINKNQTAGNDGGYYLSYCSLTGSDKMYYLFNRNDQKRDNVMLYSVSNKGELNNHTAVNGLEDVTIIPKAGKQVAAHTLVVPALRKHKISFAKLTFD